MPSVIANRLLTRWLISLANISCSSKARWRRCSLRTIRSAMPNKRGELGHYAGVPAVEMTLLVGDNPQRPQRDFATQIERYEQDLRHGNVSRRDPVVSALRMQRKNRRVLVERDTAGTKITRGRRTVEWRQDASQILPAETPGGGVSS